MSPGNEDVAPGELVAATVKLVSCVVFPSSALIMMVYTEPGGVLLGRETVSVMVTAEAKLVRVAVWTERLEEGPTPVSRVLILIVPSKLLTPLSVIVAVADVPGCIVR